MSFTGQVLHLMPDHTTFLRAIQDDPSDDGVRLIYADWLEEHDDPARAEFIRVQCDLAHLSVGDPRRISLEDREADLLAQHEATWLEPLAPSVVDWRFRRGFVERLTLSCRAPTDPARTLITRHPIRELEVQANYTPQPLVEIPLPERLDALHLNGLSHPNETIYSFLNTPALGRLSSLRLGWRGGWDDGLSFLRTLPCAPHLTSLDLIDLSDIALQELVVAPELVGLTSLALEWTGDAQIAVLMDQPERWTGLNFWRLPEISLSRFGDCSQLRQLGFHLERRLIGAMALPARLKDLRFSADPAGVNQILRTLLDGGDVSTVQRLSITYRGDATGYEEHDWQLLAGVLGKVKGPIVDLTLDEFGTGGLAAFGQLPHLERLARLRFSRGQLDAASLRALCQSDRCRGLRGLTIGPGPVGAPPSSVLTSDQLQTLVEAPFLRQLRTLNLGGVQLGDAGVETLLQALTQGRLTTLRLRNVGLQTARSVAALANWPGLARLRTLDLSDNSLRASAIKPLAETRSLSPLLRLVLLGYYHWDTHQTTLTLGPLLERLGQRLSIHNL